MRKYYTYTKPRITGGYIPIDEHLNENFKNIPFEWGYLYSGGLSDSRELIYIDIEDVAFQTNGKTYYPVDYYNVIIKQSMMFNMYEESASDALVLVERWSGRDDIDLTDGIITIPASGGEDI